MAFCMNCGKQLPDGAKFCLECGTKLGDIKEEQTAKREMIYEGTIYKCPNCGDTLDAYESVCESCGYEPRNVQSTNAVRILAQKIEEADSIEKREVLIRNFYIPNTKEDILEFSIFTMSNLKKDSACKNAWLAKMEQIYEKAKLTLKDTPELSYLEKQYKRTMFSVNSRSALSITGKMLLGLWHLIVGIFKIIWIIAKWLGELIGKILVVSGKIIKTIVTSKPFLLVCKVILGGLALLLFYLIMEC